MGYVFVTSACCNCGRFFSYHPHKVPSANGEPVCAPCVEWANPRRIERGLAPIVPLPGAYEPCPESEL